jgi:predicted GTPase
MNPNINVFENLSSIKEQVCGCAAKALENDLLSAEEHNAIVKKVRDDTLVIGVIGQMKAGKSTFLNAFLFRDKVLPAAATPMTASLSVITYGEKEEVEAEFYTKSEWEEIAFKAALWKKMADAGEEADSDIKAAAELFENSKKLGDEIDGLLSGRKSVGLRELEEYVGADGRYTPITKSVTVKMADTRLKGIQVVDTPGFNDPVASREERTKEFLSRADVVILLLYAGQAFTEEDRKIAFNHLKYAGVGKVIFAVNKYDVGVEEGDMEDAIKKHVRDAISLEIEKNKNDVILKKMLENPNPVLLSAQMALLYHLGPERINADEDDKYHYDRLNDTFEFKSPKDLLDRSKIAELETEINNILSKEKLEILCRKPIGLINGKITEKKLSYEQAEMRLSGEKKNLALSLGELTAKKEKLEKNKAAIEKIIAKNKLQLTIFLDEKLRDTERALLNYKRRCIENMRNIVNCSQGYGCGRQLNNTLRELEFEFTERLKTLAGEVRVNFGRQSDDMLDTIKAFIEDYEYIEKGINEKLQAFNNISFEKLFCVAEFAQYDGGFGWSTSSGGGGWGAVGGGIGGAATGLAIGEQLQQVAKEEGIWGNAGRIGLGPIIAVIGGILGFLIGHGASRASERAAEVRRINAIRENMHAQIDKIPGDISEAEAILQNVRKCADGFIGFFEKDILEDIVDPMLADLENTMKNTEDREKQLAEIDGRLTELGQKKTRIEEQLRDINAMIDKNLLA